LEAKKGREESSVEEEEKEGREKEKKREREREREKKSPRFGFVMLRSVFASSTSFSSRIYSLVA
jgi:hypothetical protein